MSRSSVKESDQESEEHEKIKRMEVKDGEVEENIKVVARRTPSL